MMCSGVVVHDEGKLSSTGLRIASASAAVVVSAAVAAAALIGGSSISDPRPPVGGDASHSVPVAPALDERRQLSDQFGPRALAT